MNNQDQLIQQRLRALELAKELGSVSEACRQCGISRTQFYEYKRRYEQHGLEGLKDRLPIPKHHPLSTSPELVQTVIDLSIQHPMWGCGRISEMLKLEGNAVSSPTVQTILMKHELGDRKQRADAIERQYFEIGQDLTQEQIDAVEKLNPCFRERHAETTCPGELLVAAPFYFRTLAPRPAMYLHAVVDTYCSYGFGIFHPSKRMAASLAVIRDSVLPFYRELGLPIQVVSTTNRPEFGGARTSHSFRSLLASNGIESTAHYAMHRSGFIIRFQHDVESEFVPTISVKSTIRSIKALNAAFDEWLTYYNNQRPHHGYRNMGRSPHHIIDRYLQSVRKEP